jgi:hypothetical protein
MLPAGLLRGDWLQPYRCDECGPLATDLPIRHFAGGWSARAAAIEAPTFASGASLSRPSPLSARGSKSLPPRLSEAGTQQARLRYTCELYVRTVLAPAPRRRVLTGYTVGGQINDLKEKERDI